MVIAVFRRVPAAAVCGWSFAMLGLTGCPSECADDGYRAAEPLDALFPVTEAAIAQVDTNQDGTISTDECRVLCDRAIEMGLDSVDECDIVSTDTGTGQAVHCTGMWRQWCYD